MTNRIRLTVYINIFRCINTYHDHPCNFSSCYRNQNNVTQRIARIYLCMKGVHVLLIRDDIWLYQKLQF